MAHPRDDAPELGPEQLKALTHPLRVRMLKELRIDGPATASLLARRLGESSGATSYHLRQLERHGFVEQDPDRVSARERWWRPAFGGHYVDAAKWLDDPEQRGVYAVYTAGVVAVSSAIAQEFVAEQDTWSDEWVEAADLSDFRLRLNPARLRALVETLHERIESFESHEDPEGELVTVIVQAFPRRVRPFTEEAS